MFILTVIFHWIIISSATASVLTGIILFIKLIFKNRQGANWHYYIWFILVIRLLIPYTPVSSISIFNAVTPAVEKLSMNQGNLSNYVQNKVPIKEGILENPKETTLDRNIIINESAIKPLATQITYLYNKYNLMTKFTILWLMGVLVFTFYIIFVNFRLLTRSRKYIKVDAGPLNIILNECKSLLNIKVNLQILLTNEVSSPSLIGFLRPNLLLPIDISKKINDDELKHIFLHELSHYKRKDNVINGILVYLKILHWFNPIIWYGFYKMHQDCEIACDARAMSSMNTEEQSMYGYTIIHLLKITSPRKSIPGSLGILSDKSEMKRRINMISLFNKKSIKCSSVGLVLLIVLSCILLTNGKNSYASNDKIVEAENKSGVSSIDKKKQALIDASSSNNNNLENQVIIPNDAQIYLSSKEINGQSLFITEELKNIYQNYSKSKNDALLKGLTPLDIFRLYNTANEDKNIEMQVALIELPPEVTANQFIQEQATDKVSQDNEDKQLAIFHNFKGNMLERIVDDKKAYILIQDNGWYRMEKDKNGIWKLGWLASQ
ncbi:MAG: M56 family metallopeptidase [Clostridiaceae bacterium]|nr:M56 family metallopeptidase [Clostridiaceae bacterium]